MADIACPKCGQTGGYFILRRATLKTFFSFEGEVFDSEVTRDNTSTQARKCCGDCGKDITAFVDSLAHPTTSQQNKADHE